MICSKRDGSLMLSLLRRVHLPKEERICLFRFLGLLPIFVQERAGKIWCQLSVVLGGGPKLAVTDMDAGRLRQSQTTLHSA